MDYDLKVEVFADERRLAVSGSMRIPAASAPRPYVEFSLSTLMQDLQVEVAGPNANKEAAVLEKVKTEGSWIGQDGKPNEDVVYRIRPAQPFPPDEAVDLRFSYSGNALTGLLLYVGPEVSFATAWGTTWYPQERDQPLGVGSLTISVPAGQAAIASGAKRSSAEDEARGSFRFETENPTLFAFASGKYTIVRSEGAIPTSVYLLRARENMQQYANGAAGILKVLEKEFGAYRFKEFALVEIPRPIAQAAGFNAATMQGFAWINSNAFNVPASNLNVLAEWYGHEFSHEWWPHVVSLERPGGRFIEEMLAEYGGLRVVETVVGAEAAERFRRQGYEPDPIYSALGYFKVVGKGIDGKLGDLPADEKVRDIAYNKGFLVWDMLSREIGREKFQQILSAITARHVFQKITLTELWSEIEAGAGRKLDWFYEQWFERTGAPDFALEWKQTDGVVRIAVTQPAPYYRATLDIEFRGDQDQRLLRTMTVGGARSELTVPVEFRVASVVLDPHYYVLRWTPEYRAAAEDARKAAAPSP
ncbi:MAG TPA: M1 family aminopeptidase [Thermoanaerobaculia bacterium]|nr:M1 family aminopeptidase [Thermoanaerobaculia bacterium]